MNRRTQLALASINRAFYEQHAAHFSTTRGQPWPGWRRVRDLLPKTGDVAVADIGCGNGRLGVFLRDELGERLAYHGFDESRELLSFAEGELRGWARLSTLDLLQERVSERVAPAVDLVALFGVLHHLPGQALRTAVVRDCLSVLKPGGLLALTSWQFALQPRFKGRLLSWSAAREFEVDPVQLEPGDHLLAWGNSDAFRYCHALDRRELEDWSRLLQASLAERFFSDGASGDLNEYLILRKH